jgi:hypothetical protein
MCCLITSLPSQTPAATMHGALEVTSGLGRKLFKNRYQADTDRLLALNLHAQHAFWGAEVAAQRLTRYLKPEHFTIYLRGDGKPLFNQARMRLDPKGNTEVLQAFWGFPEDPNHPDLVPPYWPTPI